MFDALTILALTNLFQFLFTIFILWSWFKNRMRAEQIKREVVPRAKAIARQTIEEWVALKSRIAEKTPNMTGKEKKDYVTEKALGRFPGADEKELSGLIDKTAKELG